MEFSKRFPDWRAFFFFVPNYKETVNKMDYNHFFNFYGYETQDGWTGRETQLKAAGYDDSKVENTFGKGWSDNGTYPTNVDKEGEFMSRNEQLADIDKKLDINKYELVYGKGYEAKPE